MQASDFQARSNLRWAVYSLLIVVCAALMTARVMSVTNGNPSSHFDNTRPSALPFFGANDKSRIATVRALVEHGTYAIDDIIYQGFTYDKDGDGYVDYGDWYTLDRVRHTDRNGELRTYSSKPTLFPTLLAGEYWVIHSLTGTTLGEEPFYIGRIMLMLTNVLPMVFYLFVIAYIVDQWGRTDYGRIFTVAAGAFATFLPTFSVTINNHLPAAISCSLAVLAALKIWYDGDHRWFWFVASGLFGAFTAANELPALSFLCMLTAALLWKAPWKTLLIHVPAAAVVVVGAIGTNYLAHNDWRTPYAHRGDGATLKTITDDSLADELNQQRLPEEVASAITEITPETPPSKDAEVVIDKKDEGNRWLYRDRDESVRFALVRKGDAIEIRDWDDWYRFQGGYWFTDAEDPIDRGEESRLAYLFHCTFGHHGIFSLTPIWLLALVGTGYLLVSPRSDMRAFALFVATTSIVVFAFYMTRGVDDRNYGGWTCGLRWMFWFTPMWLLMLLPSADWLSRSRWGQALALALVAISVFSAYYASGNPWTHPWLFDYWTYLEWINITPG